MWVVHTGNHDLKVVSTKLLWYNDCANVLEDPGFESRKGRKAFVFQNAQNSRCGPSVTESFCRGAKQPGREPDYPSVSSFDVKNEWNYSSIPPHAFMECKTKLYCFSCIIKKI